MEKFVIEGGKKLSGSIKVLGAKNSALPIIAASLLSSGKVKIDNIPLIEDVFVLLDLLKSIGVEVDFVKKREIQISTKRLSLKSLDYSLIEKIRSSIFLFGVLPSKFKKFKMPKPGGCHLGARIIDPHIDALRPLGVFIRKDGNFFVVEKKNTTKKKIEIVLSEFSVTATENVILASVLEKGKTIDIYNAACEPYILDLVHFLRKGGAKIKGEGTHHIQIEGVPDLNFSDHFLMYDPIEMGTFLTLGAAVGKRIIIENFVPEFLRTELLKFKEANVKFSIKNLRTFNKGFGYKVCELEVLPSKLKSVKKVHNMPYPGFAPDLLPLFAVLMTQAKGVSLIYDWMYEGRMRYIEELKRMGADAFVCDLHKALITGPTQLHGTKITSFDLRAGATLIIAALLAKGKSEIFNIYQVDRGYESLDKRLKKIGAKIKRVKI